MSSKNFKRITIDIQVPTELELSEEQRSGLMKAVDSFVKETSEYNSLEGMGGIVADSYDNLRAHRQIVLALGYKSTGAVSDTGK